MTAPGATGRWPATARLAGIGVAAAAVAIALYVAGRLHTPDYNFSLFGRVGLDALMLKSTLASIALGVAALQVLLALWIYRKLPLAASPPRPVRLAHRIIGFALFALTVPIALHCLIAYGVQLTSIRAAVHSLAGSFSTVPSSPRSCSCRASGCPAGRCRLPGARSVQSSACSGTPPCFGLQRLPASWHVARAAPASPGTCPPPRSPVRVPHRQRALDGHPCCAPGR